MLAALSLDTLVVHVLLPRCVNTRSARNVTACGRLLAPRRRWSTSVQTMRDLRMHSCLACVHALAPRAA